MIYIFSCVRVFMHMLIASSSVTDLCTRTRLQKRSLTEPVPLVSAGDPTEFEKLSTSSSFLRYMYSTPVVYP